MPAEFLNTTLLFTVKLNKEDAALARAVARKICKDFSVNENIANKMANKTKSITVEAIDAHKNFIKTLYMLIESVNGLKWLVLFSSI